MANDEPVKGPVVLRIKLRYDDLDTMVHRFAPNVGKSGLFLPTRSLQPIGAEIKFELRLANDQAVLVGHGRVKAVREPDPKHPKQSFGMAVELLRVTRESRDVIMRMLERRKTLGLAEVAIPMPDDLEMPRPAEPSGPVLTAPRRQSGPIAIQKLAEVAALAPEPPRKKRPVIQELIASASGPVVMRPLPELDEQVDVAAAIARARVLAGSDLDAELEALRDAQAAPIEISIEAASAELARQLGGAAVRRDRSAGWAAPPQVIEAVTEPVVARTRTPVIEGEQLDELLQDDAPKDPDVAEARSRERRLHLRTRTKSRDLQPMFEQPIVPLDEPAPVEVSDAEVVGETVLANMPFDTATAPEEVDILQAPSLLAAEDPEDGEDLAELDDDDLEEVEGTQGGVDPDAFAAHAYATEPAYHDDPALADALDAQLAEAEAEALGADDEGLAAEELADDDILAEADADDADLMQADGEADAVETAAEPALPGSTYEPEPAFEPDQLYAPETLPPEALAAEEAPEHLPPDEDLHVPVRHAPRRATSDFMSRLDFTGEETPLPVVDPLAGFERDSTADFADFGRQPLSDLEDEAPIQALPVERLSYDIPAIEEDDFHERRAKAPPQISVRTNRLAPDETFMEPPAEPAYEPAAAPDDLDDALQALDVDDDDDLSIPLQPIPQRPAPIPTRVPKPRATSDDGILIDFDDDD